MDNQLIQDFNKLYFSKKQISRRVFDKDELENIWKIIELERKELSNANNFNCKELNGYWYNNTEDIVNNCIFIDEVNNLEIFNYLSSRIKNNIKKSAEESEILYLFSLENIELIDDVRNNIELILNKNSKINREFICNLYNIIENKNILNNEKNEDEYYSYICKTESSLDNIANFLGFINNEKNEKNNLIKAAIIYFYILDTKPFLAYNNILGKLISYTYLLNSGYEIFKYCIVSNLIKEKSKKYNSAIENSITSNGDITYFIRFYIDMLRKSIEDLNGNLNYKFGKKIIKELIEKNNIKIEDRQVKFINSILISRVNLVTIDNYRKKQNVSYETSRSDLNYLVTLGFLKIAKIGKRYEYYMNDISTIIDNFEE